MVTDYVYFYFLFIWFSTFTYYFLGVPTSPTWQFMCCVLVSIILLIFCLLGAGIFGKSAFLTFCVISTCYFTYVLSVFIMSPKDVPIPKTNEFAYLVCFLSLFTSLWSFGWHCISSYYFSCALSYLCDVRIPGPFEQYRSVLWESPRFYSKSDCSLHRFPVSKSFCYF